LSHIVQIQTQVRDPLGIRAACQRLRLEPPVYGEAKLFSGTRTGWNVRLTGWEYPLVCDVERGQLSYDHYEGRWGDPQQLDRFLQAYAVEKAKLEARRQGHTVAEQPLADGTIRLTIQVGE
jgi:hypothetical protein